MTPTSVGMRCPECARDRTKVRTMRSASRVPIVTRALIVINVVVFLAETASGVRLGGCSGPINGCGSVWYHGVLAGPFISSEHQYWRIVTAGFLHDGILHIAVNMVSLYFVGSALEPAIGAINFAAIYFVSLLAGSFGALLFQPLVPTVGASGAIFGIFGALIVVAYHRGIPIWQSGLGMVLLVNLIFSVTFSGISIGGHLGGLVAGLICGEIVVQCQERRRIPMVAYTGFALVAVASVAGALAVAGSQGLTPSGLTI
ncbi:MAG: rhomboid family intramembrane serine protease [Solirubrobacterales bacterium]|nr:rhomboid family intramembrane serine protease [Solirubrobacterales bacterium]